MTQSRNDECVIKGSLNKQKPKFILLNPNETSNSNTTTTITSSSSSSKKPKKKSFIPIFIKSSYRVNKVVKSKSASNEIR